MYGSVHTCSQVGPAHYMMMMMMMIMDFVCFAVWGTGG
jgi:hypothetical protein